MQNVSSKELIKRARYAINELMKLGYTREAIATELSRILKRSIKAHCLEDIGRAVEKRTTDRPLKPALHSICVAVIKLHGKCLLNGVLSDPTFQADATGLRNAHTRHPLQTGDPESPIANFIRTETFNLVLALSRLQEAQPSDSHGAGFARTHAALQRCEDLLHLSLALNPLTNSRCEPIGFALTAPHRILDLPNVNTSELDRSQLQRIVGLAKESSAAISKHLPDESSSGVVAHVAANAAYLIARISTITQDETEFASSFDSLLHAGHSLAALPNQTPYTRDMASAASTNALFLLDQAAASLPKLDLNPRIEAALDLLESLPPSTLKPTLGSLAKAPLDPTPNLSHHLAAQQVLADRWNQLLGNIFNIADPKPSALKSKLISAGIRALPIFALMLSVVPLLSFCGISNV